MTYLLEELIQVIEIAYPDRADFEYFFELGALDKKSENPAKSLAKFVIDLFGHDTSLIDNSLTPTDRSVLNKIMDKTGIVKIINMNEEEYFIFSDGQLRKKRWRIHYWDIDFNKINAYLGKTEKQEEDISELYGSLPDEVWEKTTPFP